MALVRGRTAWVLSGLLLAMVLLLPLLAVSIEAFSMAGDVWQHVSDNLLAEYLANSLKLAAGVAMLALLMGVPTAWLVTMYSFPGRKLLSVLLMMPLAIPAYILAYIYADIFAVTGTLHALFGDWLPQIHSLSGAIAVLALALYPYVYLLCRPAFIDQPSCILEAARVLGCSRWMAFRRVALPMARPAVVAAMALVIMETLADYGVSQYYGVQVLTIGIFRAWGGLDSAAVACRLAFILLAFSGILMGIELFFRRRARYHNPTDRKMPLGVTRLTGIKAITAMAFCALPVVAGFVLPFAYLLYMAFLSFADSVNDAFAILLWQSFWLAALTACIALLVALFFQVGLKIHGGRLMRVFSWLLRLGYGVPGTVVAVGLLVSLFWLQQTLYALGVADVLLVGSVLGLVFAYLVRFMIVPLQSLENGLGRIRPSISEVARSMGVAGTGLARRVYLPVMQGSVWLSLLIVFVEVVKELPATLLLRPFDFNTLAVRTYELANDERLLEAAWPALSIVLVCLVPVILLLSRVNDSRSYVMVPAKYA